MANTTFVSTLMNLRMTNAVLADGSLYDPNRPYKALVCLFFNGAIDSFNVLAPHGTTQGIRNTPNTSPLEPERLSRGGISPTGSMMGLEWNQLWVHESHCGQCRGRWHGAYLWAPSSIRTPEIDLRCWSRDLRRQLRSLQQPIANNSEFVNPRN